jgi:DNA mismatch endonuclease (patch repair protein)
MDVFDKKKRKNIMSKVKGKNTTPELVVRRLLHGLGYRYRLHGKDLPGNPDLVFPGKKKVIFVHGCFWHQHNCKKAKRPTTNCEFWNAKLDKTIRRDNQNILKLKDAGWKVHVIWECQINDKDFKDSLINFLEND